jgi:diaminohydroxyphosphoribosylaminopyrimidine deaminase/5-amino-6-(5-phosphoribosylamino)uracil reductase
MNRTTSISNKNRPIFLNSGFTFGGPLTQIMNLHPGFNLPVTASNGSSQFWMLEAFKESLKGIGISNPNPAVGCVLVDSNGNEISRGHTHAYRGIHAERDAFQKVAQRSRLKNATAYVTLEPCSHKGHQDPCMDLILNSEIHKVVIARKDPNPIVNGQAIDRLSSAGKEVEIGLFSNEVTAWNFPFFSTFQLKRPLVALKWAQTLDGQLADDSGNSKWISGSASRAYTHWLRQRYDLILVGAQTALKDFPQLDVRDCIPPIQSQPLPVIFDPSGICFNADESVQDLLLQKTFAPHRKTIVVTTQNTLNQFPHSWLEKQGHIILLSIQGIKSVHELVEVLSGPEVEQALGHPLQSIFVEGGPKTLTSFLNEGYADLIHLFTAPIFTGGKLNRIQTQKELKSAFRFHPMVNLPLCQDSLTELVSENLLSIF